MQQGGAPPSMGDIFKAMRGGTQTNHNLELRLGTQRPATPGPNANHTSGPANPAERIDLRGGAEAAEKK